MKKNSDPSTNQSVGLGLIESISQAMKPVKALEAEIVNSLGKNEHSVLGEAGSYEVAALAIDALGDSDPSFLANLYQTGGKISDEVVADIATAIIWSKRRRSNSLEEFKKLSKKHGRDV